MLQTLVLKLIFLPSRWDYWEDSMSLRIPYSTTSSNCGIVTAYSSRLCWMSAMCMANLMVHFWMSAWFPSSLQIVFHMYGRLAEQPKINWFHLSAWWNSWTERDTLHICRFGDWSSHSSFLSSRWWVMTDATRFIPCWLMWFVYILFILLFFYAFWTWNTSFLGWSVKYWRWLVIFL